MHIGPTNSGKTFDALQAFRNADEGAYLAPLRLLALEVAENTNELEEAFKEAFDLGTPAVIECIVPEEDNVLPMVPPNGSVDNIIMNKYCMG